MRYTLGGEPEYFTKTSAALQPLEQPVIGEPGASDGEPGASEKYTVLIVPSPVCASTSSSQEASPKNPEYPRRKLPPLLKKRSPPQPTALPVFECPGTSV